MQDQPNVYPLVNPRQKTSLVKEETLRKLQCVKCKAGPFDTVATNGRLEALVCRACRHSYPFQNGIINAGVQDPKVLGEVAQWAKFADSEGWLHPTDLYLESLPSRAANILAPKDTITWMDHEYNFFRTLDGIQVKGRDLLDLGAGRCWSSKWLALLGANVIALDALDHPTIGLGAGDVYMRNHPIHFDRIAGDFNELPLLAGTFDVVLVSGSLHHSLDIERSMAEIVRVLRPRGTFVLVNEPVSNFRAKVEAVQMTGHQEGINEHAYRITRLLDLFQKHGLRVERIQESLRVYEPGSGYYQGWLGSFINRAMWTQKLWLTARGGILNCVAARRA